MTGASSMKTETVRTDFMGLFGMHSSELEESTKNAAHIVHIHDDGRSNSLQGDKRYRHYFNGSIGPLDGTHVPVMVTPVHDALRLVNQKGTASLNVLGICNHNMLFTYRFVRMAGSTHDSRVLGYRYVR